MQFGDFAGREGRAIKRKFCSVCVWVEAVKNGGRLLRVVYFVLWFGPDKICCLCVRVGKGVLDVHVILG